MPDGSEKPVGVTSHTLSKAENNYSHLDKEVLAIIFGVKKYHQYLYGRHSEIQTDHKPLTHLFNENKTVPAMASGRIQRWALLLSAYGYSIRYKQGKTNANADALSRFPLPSEACKTPMPAGHPMECLDATHLSSSHIRWWTDQDLTLSKGTGRMAGPTRFRSRNGTVYSEEGGVRDREGLCVVRIGLWFLRVERNKL